MADHAKCDHCAKEIASGSGYLFYSPSGIQVDGVPSVPVIGRLFYCDACAQSIVNPGAWQSDTGQEVFLAEGLLYQAIHPETLSGEKRDPHPLEVIEALHRAKAWNFVDDAKRLGVTAEQARAKGRELALRWWVDPARAETEAAAYWGAKPENAAAGAPSAGGGFRITGCGIAAVIVIGMCLLSIPFIVMFTENEKNAAREELKHQLSLLKDGKGSEAYAASARFPRRNERGEVPGDHPGARYRRAHRLGGEGNQSRLVEFQLDDYRLLHRPGQSSRSGDGGFHKRGRELADVCDPEDGGGEVKGRVVEMELLTIAEACADRCRHKITTGASGMFCWFDYSITPHPELRSTEIVIAGAADDVTVRWFPHIREGMLQAMAKTEELGRRLVSVTIEIQKVIAHDIDTAERGCIFNGSGFMWNLIQYRAVPFEVRA